MTVKPVSEIRPGRGHTRDAPFVGRQLILRQLCERLARSDEPGERLILVTGEPGVGKTRLLQELAIWADAQGAAVLWGGRGVQAREFACGPFAVALEGFASSRSDAARASCPSDARRSSVFHLRETASRLPSGEKVREVMGLS